MILLLGLCFSISATLVLQGCSSDEKTAPETKEENSAEIDYHTCTMHPSVKEKEPGTCPICAMDLTPVFKETAQVDLQTSHEEYAHENEIDYHTCTMHPSVKQKEPGKCPICSMDLVSVYKEGGSPQAKAGDRQVRTVNVPLYQQQLIGVQLDTVKLRSASKTMRAIGHVAFNERKIATVSLKFSGWTEKLYVDYTGQFVKKGQPLFDIYSPELV